MPISGDTATRSEYKKTRKYQEAAKKSSKGAVLEELGKRVAKSKRIIKGSGG